MRATARTPSQRVLKRFSSCVPAKTTVYDFYKMLEKRTNNRRMVSTWAKDPSLTAGWAYLVEWSEYCEFLLTVSDQKEMSTCSELAALDYANTKFSRGYSATGVGMGVCARHEFVQPNGVGDLQKGERFIRHRVSMVEAAEGSLGQATHTMLCKVMYSLGLVPGSAQTDGEGIERPWANIGGVASSTREMGPAVLAERLRTKLDRANAEYATQIEAFTTFSARQEARIPEWRAMIEEFDGDGTKKNPYYVEVKGLTEALVLLWLEQEEAKHVEAGIPGIHAVSPSSFIAAGLEVEDQQRKVRVQAELKKAATTAQEIDLIALRRDLQRNIRRLHTLQAMYTPAAILELTKHQAPEGEQPENEPLFLPSALSTAQRAEEPLHGLAVIEDELRDAQCAMSLVLLRNQLMIKAWFLLYKKLHARHQGPNTRSRTLVARNKSKIRLHSEKYQMAREAKLRLANGDKSQCGWRKLLESDIRCMEDPDELRRTQEERQKKTKRRLDREAALRAAGEIAALTPEEEERAKRNAAENTREVSWIWTGAGTGTDEEMNNALRIEWSKAYAHVRRWREEVRLVEEEARRMPLLLEHHAWEWEALVVKVDIDNLSAEDAEGAVAYGMKQAAMYRELARVVPIRMTELRLGRGKRRQRAQDEEDVLALDDEEELADLRAGRDYGGSAGRLTGPMRARSGVGRDRGGGAGAGIRPHQPPRVHTDAQHMRTTAVTGWRDGGEQGAGSRRAASSAGGRIVENRDARQAAGGTCNSVGGRDREWICISSPHLAPMPTGVRRDGRARIGAGSGRAGGLMRWKLNRDNWDLVPVSGVESGEESGSFLLGVEGSNEWTYLKNDAIKMKRNENNQGEFETGWKETRVQREEAWAMATPFFSGGHGIREREISLICLKSGARFGLKGAVLLISFLSPTTIFTMGRRCKHRTKEEAASAHHESVRKYSGSLHGQQARAAARTPQHRCKVSTRPTTCLSSPVPRATSPPRPPTYLLHTHTSRPTHLLNVPQPTPAMVALNACLLPDEEHLFCEALRSAEALDTSGLHIWRSEPPFVSDNDPADPSSWPYRTFTYNLRRVLHGVRLREQRERDIELRADFENDRAKAIQNLEAESMKLLKIWERVSTLKPYDPERESRKRAMLGHYKQWLARSIYHLYYLKFLE
ncbi:hypothetical protein C8R45DRAFT_927886 [Mycena sanguinolenta]|nr:hypothetical protein C8R45DRAFT_927886 [Mycena sanguinolenta]